MQTSVKLRRNFRRKVAIFALVFLLAIASVPIRAGQIIALSGLDGTTGGLGGVNTASNVDGVNNARLGSLADYSALAATVTTSATVTPATTLEVGKTYLVVGATDPANAYATTATGGNASASGGNASTSGASSTPAASTPADFSGKAMCRVAYSGSSSNNARSAVDVDVVAGVATASDGSALDNCLWTYGDDGSLTCEGRYLVSVAGNLYCYTAANLPTSSTYSHAFTASYTEGKGVLLADASARYLTYVTSSSGAYFSSSKSSSSRFALYEVTTPAPQATLAATGTYCVSLDSDLGVNFYVDMSALDGEPAQYSYVANDGQTTTTYPVKAGMLQADGTYCMTVNVVPKAMGDSVSVQVVDADGNAVSDVFTYSAKTYLDAIVAAAGVTGDTTATTASESLAALGQAALRLGAASQMAYGYDTGNLVTSDDLTALPAVDAQYATPDVEDAVSSDQVDRVYGAVTGITSRDCTLDASSTFTLRLYFDLDEGYTADDFTFTDVTGGTLRRLTPTVDASGCYVEMSAIPTINLAKRRQVKVEPAVTTVVGEGETPPAMYVTYSAMTYAYDMQDSADANVRALARAMAAYYEAAMAYCESVA